MASVYRQLPQPDSFISLSDEAVRSSSALSRLKVTEAQTESAYWQTRTTCAFARQIGFGFPAHLSKSLRTQQALDSQDDQAGTNARTDVGRTLDSLILLHLASSLLSTGAPCGFGSEGQAEAPSAAPAALVLRFYNSRSPETAEVLPARDCAQPRPRPEGPHSLTYLSALSECSQFACLQRGT